MAGPAAIEPTGATGPGRRIQKYLLLLVVIGLLASAAHAAHKLGMGYLLPRDSYTRAMMSIGVSVSRLTYGATGYNLYLPVINAMLENGFDPNLVMVPGNIDRAIAAASRLTLDPGRIRPDQIANDWGDDKGYSDFTTLAFILFGPSIESLFWLYFTLLALAVTVFLLRFWREPSALMVLACLLLAHRLTIDVLPNSTVTSVIHDSRFVPALSCVAVLHLALGLFVREVKPVVEYGCMLLQMGVLVFAVNARSSAVWQIMLLLCVILIAGYIAYRSRDLLAKVYRRPLLVTLIAFSVLVAHGIHKEINYDDRYKTAGTRTHIFWHNMYMGLGVHPSAVRVFGLLPDDATVYHHALEYIRANPDARASLGLQSAVLDHPLFEHVGWKRYDSIVGKMYWDFVRAHPGYVTKIFLYYKPRYLLEQLLWQFGMKDSFPLWIDVNPVHRPAGDKRVSPAAASTLVALLMIAFASVPLTGVPHATLLLIVAGLFAASLIPSLLVVPFYYDLPVAFVTLATLGAVLFIVAFDKARRRLSAMNAKRL